VKNEKFGEAVDIFSQFFKEPLFTDSATDRELNAVDNEYKKNISSELRAKIQIEKSHIVKPGSILDRFATGNLETLKVPGLMDELRAFYKGNYSSNLMNLVMVGRHSLDDLQKLAEENFSKVEDRDLPFRDFSDQEVYDREHSFGRVVKIVPQRLIKDLQLNWILPTTERFDREKTSSLLSSVLGHEGPNSLLSCLKKENLALSLVSGVGSRLNGGMNKFYVTVSLTDKGEREFERVIDIVYMFINQFKAKAAATEVPDYIYEEIK